MALIDPSGLRDDTWTRVEENAPLPASGDIVVSLARLEKDTAALAQHDGKVGVALASDDEPSDVAPHLDKLQLITVDFPKFTDGRGYSIARLLRQRHGYRGELRAVGEVLRDQLLYMKRCGFDSFDIAPGKDPQEALGAFDEFTVTYQGAADEPRPLFRRRARG